jgi:hypothetical protein
MDPIPMKRLSPGFIWMTRGMALTPFYELSVIAWVPREVNHEMALQKRTGSGGALPVFYRV